MGCIFGYLVVIIFVKWFIDWQHMTIQPPSLINMLIGMFLSPGNVPADKTIYTGQSTVQAILLIIAFLSLPVLLIPKPLLLLREHKRRMKYASLHEELTDEMHGEHARLASHDMTAAPLPEALNVVPASNHGHGHVCSCVQFVALTKIQ